MFSRAILLYCCLLFASCSQTTQVQNQASVDPRFFHDELFNDPPDIQQLPQHKLYQLPSIYQDALKPVASLPTSLERLIKLRQWIYTEIADYHYDTTTTVTVAELPYVKKINCFSFAVLFQAAANYVNVPAEIHLIDMAPHWDSSTKALVYLQHISVITKIQGFYTTAEISRLTQQNVSGEGHSGALLLKLNYLNDINPTNYQIPERSQALTDKKILARYYINKSLSAFITDNLAQAYNYNKQALIIDPTSAAAWNNLGVIYSKAGALLSSRDAYLQSIHFNKNILSSYNNLYSIYFRLGDRQTALQLIASMDADLKESPYFYFNLGEASASEGDYLSAVELFKTAIRYKDDERMFYVSLAHAQLKLNRPTLAANNLKIAETLNNTNVVEEELPLVKALLTKI